MRQPRRSSVRAGVAAVRHVPLRLVCAAALGAPATVVAQDILPSGGVSRPDGSRAAACEPRDAGNGNDGYRGFACEQRTLTLSPRARLGVDGGPNGGVAVRGADSVRAPRVTAVVTANARTDDEAARVVAVVRIVDDGGRLRAEGPEGRDDDRGNRAWWSVRWRVEVPRRTDLDLRATNGGLRVAGVTGRLRLDTNNGGIVLDSVGGAVVARSNNGGAVATLAGRRWDAAGLGDTGLDLHSNNGGAVLRLPADYSAHVHVATRNGPLAVDFPVTVQGRLDRHQLDFDLGAGGPSVRVTTNNGGARLGRVP